MNDVPPNPQLVEDLSLVFTHASNPVSLWIWAVAGLLAMAAAAVGFWYWRKRRLARSARGGAGAGHSDGPADAWALKRLAALRERAGMVSPPEFALEVSQILRVFLERRFSLRAAHQSTEEFLLDARESATLSESQQQRLREFLACCDLAKFARRYLEDERKQALLESAVLVVNEATAAAAASLPPRTQASRPHADGNDGPARATAA